jgi:hypothetical protein
MTFLTFTAKLMAPLMILCLALTSVYGEDSFYKMRIYRPFLQDLFSQNLRLIFSRLKPSLAMKDVQLPDINAKMTNFHLQITPFMGREVEDVNHP